MELKVWVEGIQRIVCGVTENTTCQDVVYALAHATGKTGRFTLIERWRNNERLLAPQDHPLRILTKWGEYSNDVQLILQRSAIEPPPLVTSPQHLIQPSVAAPHTTAIKQQPKSPPPTIVGPPRTTKGGVLESPTTANPLHGFTPTNSSNSTNQSSNNNSDQSGIVTPERNKDIRKSLTFSGGHHGSSRGGRPLEVRHDQQLTIPRSDEESSSPQAPVNTTCSSDGTASPFSYRGGPTTSSKREAPPYREPPRPLSPPTSSQHQPPPYRDPPPPAILSPSKRNNTPPLSASSSNSQKPASVSSSSPSHESPTPPPSTSTGIATASTKPVSKPKRNLLKQTGENDPPRETVLYNAQYRDLIRLVNFQREKLAGQQAELNKFDAEIVFWEGKTREHQNQMDFLAQEAARIEMASRQSEEQLRVLAKVEEESEIVRQQEKTLKSELTLLRSKLANCETELLQCKNKIRLLLEELQMEQRLITRETEDRQSLERSIIHEVERLQRDVEQSKVSFEMTVQRGENFKRELSTLENSITEKKQQVERLVSEMKEANLESLAIAPPEEIKHLIEGPHKPGSTRKMIGSPRQLENAVPTSKNPHGVWV